MKKLFIISLSLLSATSTLAYPRATNSIIPQFQAQDKYSINPIEGKETRFGLSYVSGSGEVEYLKTDTVAKQPNSLKGNGYLIGFDKKISDGHFSVGYSSSSSSYDWAINYPNDIWQMNLENRIQYTDIYFGYQSPISNKSSLGVSIESSKKKAVIYRRDTFTVPGYTWTSTGTDIREFSGEAEVDLTDINVFGRKELEDFSLGYLFSPQTGGDASYDNDYTNLKTSYGHGLKTAISVGAGDKKSAAEFGIKIEQEDDNSESSSKTEINLIYEGDFSGTKFGVYPSITDSKKLEKNGEVINLPYRENSIAFIGDIEVEEDINLSLEYLYSSISYGDGGDDYDSTRADKFTGNFFALTVKIFM